MLGRSCPSLCSLAALLVALPLTARSDEDCWGGDFTEKLCCGGRFSVVGNPACWDSEFTYARCCGVSALPRREQDDKHWDASLPPSDVAASEEDFDYIVVGAGSAGSVVAARLALARGSDGQPFRVLLLEAGGVDLEPVPADPDVGPEGPERWWPPLSASWKVGPVDGEWSYRTGRGAGGSASVNSMVYHRGSPSEYTELGWSTQEVLRAFRRLEAAPEAPGFDLKPGFHRDSDDFESPPGYPLSLVSAERNELTPIFRGLVDAFEAHGVPFRVDPHGSETIHGIGGTWRSFGCFHAARCTPTRVGRVRHALGRPRATTFDSLVATLNESFPENRLEVRGGAQVTRVLLDSDARTRGVEVVRAPLDGHAAPEDASRLRRSIIRAKREVILSAGVFASPKLLTLSGIGEAQELERLGVPISVDSPEVGSNFAEHVGFSILVLTGLPCPEGSHVDGSGRHTNLGDTADFIGQIYGFFNVTENKPGQPGPAEAEVMLLEGCLGGKFSLTFTLLFLHPESRGRVVVQSRNPLTPLHVDYQPFSHGSDLPAMVNAVRWLYANILTSPALVRFNLQFTLPLEWVQDPDSGPLTDFVLQNLYWYQHPSGTCRGSAVDSRSVVDRELRVRGVRGLRVADASVLAEQPSGHSDGPSRLVGQMAADFILADAAAEIRQEKGVAGESHEPPAHFAPAALLKGYNVWMPLRGFGTNGFTGESGIEGMSRFLGIGGRLLDSALLYENGGDIASAISRSGLRREDVFITSKVPPTRMGFNEARLAVEAILTELRTSYLDLVLIHWPALFDWNDPQPPCALTEGSWPSCRRDTWMALEQLHREGKVRAIGVSNFVVRHLQDILQHPGRTLPVAVNQVELHPWYPQLEMREFCKKHDIQLTAFGSMGSSLLGGAMLQAGPVVSVARSHGKSPGQVLLRWALQLGIAVIPSSSSDSRMRENFAIANWKLDQAGMDTLNGVRMEEWMKVYQPDPANAP